jgi:hypothetical protein
VKTFASVGVALASLLAGCSSAASLAFTPTSSGATTGGTTGSQPEIGTPCGATAVVDVCATVGLVCDLISAKCRLPEMGEPCTELELRHGGPQWHGGQHLLGTLPGNRFSELPLWHELLLELLPGSGPGELRSW